MYNAPRSRNENAAGGRGAPAKTMRRAGSALGPADTRSRAGPYLHEGGQYATLHKRTTPRDDALKPGGIPRAPSASAPWTSETPGRGGDGAASEGLGRADPRAPARGLRTAYTSPIPRTVPRERKPQNETERRGREREKL